jgi:pSer/pThr/pTyr-binding forkhead associated (FHA) protein
MSDTRANDADGAFPVDNEETLVYRPDAPPGEVSDAARFLAGAFRYALVVERGPQAGLAYVLGEGPTVAGRSEDVDIFLGDVTVSRQHARFVVDAAGLRVEDLRSTNGTYVNGARTDSAALAEGDEVIVGKFHLLVRVGNA